MTKNSAPLHLAEKTVDDRFIVSVPYAYARISLAAAVRGHQAASLPNDAASFEEMRALLI